MSSASPPPKHHAPMVTQPAGLTQPPTRLAAGVISTTLGVWAVQPEDEFGQKMVGHAGHISRAIIRVA